MPFLCPQAAELARRLKEPRRFIQAVTGPRQVGKTTLVQQVVGASAGPAGSERKPAGRFEVLRLPHWSFREMNEALRLGFSYSGQPLSYAKVVGRLQDAGNTVTLAHYLDLLYAAGMLTGLQKYAGQAVRQRGSSPKLQVLNTALMTAQWGLTLPEARRDHEFWGRVVESAVGAHLANAAAADVFPNELVEVPRFGVSILACCILFLCNCLTGNLTEIEYIYETKTGKPREATVCIRPAAKAAGTAHRRPDRPTTNIR